MGLFVLVWFLTLSLHSSNKNTDLVLTIAKEITKEVKAGGCLGCSNHACSSLRSQGIWDWQRAEAVP